MANDRFKGLNSHNEAVHSVVCESLQQALLMLMDAKAVDKITITELCKKAGVSRMAFYGNYTSVDDLLEKIVRAYSADLVYRIGSPFRNEISLDWYRKMFTRVEANADILAVLFRAGFKYKYLSIVNNSVLHDPNIPANKKYLRLSWAGSIVNIIIYWIDNNLTESVEDIAKFCYQNLNEIAKKA